MVADNPDAQKLAQLRQSGDYAAAERYAAQRLDDPQLADVRRAELAMELARTFAEHATRAKPLDRPQLWQHAREATDRLVKKFPQNPRLLVVRTQGALTSLAEGEFSRQESEAGPDAEILLDEARSSLRSAISELKQLEPEIAAALRSRLQRPATGQLAAEDLMALGNHVRYQLARALRNQGQCYEPGSSDRVNSLAQASKTLATLSKLPPDNPLSWASRIDEIACARLSGDFAAAQARINRLVAEQPPAEAVPRLRTERIEVSLGAGQVEKALAVAGETTDAEAEKSAELDQARLKAYLAAWQKASRLPDSRQGAEFEERIGAVADHIRQAYAPVWSRRAEVLISATVGKMSTGGDVDTLVRAATREFQLQRFEESLALYDRASEQALDKGQKDRSFDLAYAAAAIEDQRQRHRPAMQRYRKLALNMPEHPKAADAHLMAVYHAGQASREDQPLDLTTYQTLLEEHLQEWPLSKTTGQAAWWLGNLLKSRGKWTEALQTYKQVPSDHGQFPSAVAAMAACYEALFAQQQAEDQPYQGLAADAAHEFEKLIVGHDEKTPDSWSPAALAATLAAARMWLYGGPGEAAQAENVLQAALRGASEAPPQWQTSARTLLIAALAFRGRVEEAKDAFDKVRGASSGELLAMLQWLERAAELAGPSQRKEIASLELQACELVAGERDKMEPPGREAFDRTRAFALAEAGRREEALSALEPLLRQFPGDSRILETMALLESGGSDLEQLKAALAKWSRVEQASKPGTVRWFRATYGLAKTELSLGQKSRARARIKLTQASHPDLGGAEQKAEFLELLAECEH